MKIFSSFRHAWRGMSEAFRTERNFRFEILVAVLVALTALVLPLLRLERVIISLVIAAVLVLELLNSAVERIVDTLSPRIDVLAGVVKDILAAAVLLMSGAAAIIGVVIFYPYLKELLNLKF